MSSVPVLRVSLAVLRDTFAVLRQCGAGRRECQVLWTSPWTVAGTIDRVVHPRHRARGDGFELDSAWLTQFWQELVSLNAGIRVQVHTHPWTAFHSRTDDEWPVIHTPGFLSLVIPRFALGDVGFSGAYLAELGADGQWREVSVAERFEVIQ